MIQLYLLFHITFSFNFIYRYSKKENLKPGCEELMSFTHLIVGSNNRDNEEMLHYRHTHSVISTVPGFSHVTFNYNTFPPLKVKTKTQIFLLKKNNKKNNIKSGVKENIKKIVDEFKNQQYSEKKIDLNLDLLDKNAKQNKHKLK